MVVPKNSFIACFDVPFLNRHGNRTSYAMVGYNKVNLFKRYWVAEDLIESTVRNYYNNNILHIFFVVPGKQLFNSDDPNNMTIQSRSGNYFIKFINTKNLHYFNGKDQNQIFIFIGFDSWSSVVKQIYFYHNLIITGIDSSKRHYLHKIQAKLLKHLMFLTEVDIDDLENAGIVYNLPKKLINIGIDFNMINTLNEKELHYSHTKAYHIIKESYPDLIRQFVSFIDSDEKVQERSNSNLNLSLVEWSDKQTRYVDKTQLKNKKKAFNFTDKKHYSTLKPYQYNPRKDITKFNSLNKPKVCSTKSVFYSFLNRNINKFEEKDAVTFLTIERKNTVSDASHINTYLHNHNHCIVLEKTSLKIAMQNFAKAVVNEELNGVIFYNYKSLSLFLVNFDPSFWLSKQSLSNYKRRKLIFKTFMLNNKVISFF